MIRLFLDLVIGIYEAKRVVGILRSRYFQVE